MKSLSPTSSHYNGLYPILYHHKPVIHTSAISPASLDGLDTRRWYRVSMTESAETALAQTHRRQLVEWLREARAEYEAAVELYLHDYGNAAREGWSVYDSGLDTPGRVIRSRHRGYFSPEFSPTFFGLDGFDQQKLVDHIVSFFQKPENADREILILDAMGQGRSGVELRNEVQKIIPGARITVLATTLTPRRDTRGEVLEFTGNTLMDADSDPVFAEIDKRRAEGAALLVTFFRPVGAFIENDSEAPDNPYILFALYARLAKLFERSEDGSLFFLQSHTTGRDLSFLSDLLARYEASTLFSRKTGVALLKRNDVVLQQSRLPGSGKNRTLPVVDELVEKHWGLLTKYWKIPKLRTRVPAGKGQPRKS